MNGIYDYGMATLITATVVVSEFGVGDILGQAEKLTVVVILAIGCYWLAKKNAAKEKEIARLNEEAKKNNSEVTERLIKALSDSNEIGRWCREHAGNKR